jgi:hypothetical protein
MQKDVTKEVTVNTRPNIDGSGRSIIEIWHGGILAFDVYPGQFTLKNRDTRYVIGVFDNGFQLFQPVKEKVWRKVEVRMDDEDVFVGTEYVGEFTPSGFHKTENLLCRDDYRVTFTASGYMTVEHLEEE